MWTDRSLQLGQSATTATFGESKLSKINLSNHNHRIFTKTPKTFKMVQQLEIDHKYHNSIANLFTPSLKQQANPELSTPDKSQFVVERLLEMEMVVVNDITKPLIFLLNYVFPFPVKISFDGMSRRFRISKKYWLRKIICVIWQLLILWRLAIKAFPIAKESSNGIFASVVKASYVLFLLYNLALFRTFWTKSQAMVKVINSVIDFSHDLCFKFRSPPRTRLVQFTAHSSWLFVMGFSFVSHVLGGFIALLNNKNNSQDLVFGYGNSTDPTYQLNEMDPGLPKIVHAIIIIANFLNSFNWMISYLYIGTWALVFRQLFVMFYWRIQMFTKCGCVMNLPTEIRTFHKLENLIDSFNEFNGLLLMFGSIVAVLYISTSVEQAMNGSGIHSVAQITQKLHLVLSYIPVVAATLLVSDLHRTANTFSSVVKEEYNRWNKALPDRDLSEAIFGISIVHHDIVMSNIGFKGLAFFTVTYQFVTTMLGLIITYSLVVIQFFPKADNTADQPS